MSDRTRNRINAAFEDELSGAPVPPGLRAISIRGAVMAPRPQSVQPQLLVVIATVVVVAIVATFVIGSHVWRSATPVPAKPSASLVPPSPRSGAAMVYDQAHAEIVLFGGTDIRGKTVNETWTWDGKAWRLYHLAVAPSARQVAASAYDESHHDVVIFGGLPNLDDTWTWDGSAWRIHHPAHVPSLSFDWPATMAYDPASKLVVLYGFEKTATATQTAMTPETWSWNGSDWTHQSATQTPTVAGTSFANGAHLYLFTAAPMRTGGRYMGQLWRWDGNTWAHVSDFAAPFNGTIAYDRERQTFVAYNGYTWTGDGTRWTRQHPITQPQAVGYITYFAARHEVVMWGSLYGTTNNDLWAWTGATWQELEAGTIPSSSPNGQLGPSTLEAAATFIRQNTTATTPVLLPGWLPSGMEATSVIATTDEFQLNLATDQQDKTIFLGTVVGQPGPGDYSSSDTYVKFRDALALKLQTPGNAEYFVYDAGAPRSDRWLMWIEPGTMTNPQLKGPGVPYFLSASGLTDAEFWQVANSLR